MNKKSQLAKINSKILEKKRKKRRNTAFGVMAVIVTVVTVGVLMKPAIALEEDTYCGLEEHTHTQECYEVEANDDGKLSNILVDTIVEAVTKNINDTPQSHTHTDTCYETQKKLTCTEEETKGHTHTDDCYEIKRELICEDDSEDHEHTDDCYTEEKTLICDEEETKGHTHTDDCYEETQVLVCGEEETTYETINDDSYDTEEETLYLAQEDIYNETENKDDTSTTEIDTTIETTTETQTETQEFEGKLICEKEEHVHTLACYSNPDADVETAKVWEATLPSEDILTGEIGHDVAEIAKSQLGYKESTKNYEVVNEDEKKGYTRYGEWYGEPYGDWNAMFASFCLYYGGADIPTDTDYEAWVEALKEAEIYSPSTDDYTPQIGDIVFLNLDEEDGIDWVGIISEVETDGKKEETDAEIGNVAENVNGIVTIQGDVEDRVEKVHYDIDDKAIIGYAVLTTSEDDTQESDGQFKLTAKTESGITVTVSGEQDALPYPADEITLTAEDINREEIGELIDKTLEEEGLKADISYQIDITLWHELETEDNDEPDREEIEPTGTVKVTFSGLDMEETELKIYHIDETTDTAKAEDLEAELTNDGEVVVDAERFSTFVVAGTTYDVPNDHELHGEITITEMNGNYQLTGTAWTNENNGDYKIKVTGNTILDLNGHGFYYKGWSSLFEVQSGATFTIIDTSASEPSKTQANNTLYGNSAKVEYESNGNKVTKLTYYVTESHVKSDGITTDETLYKYELTPTGMIVGEYGYGCNAIVKVQNNGTFNLEGGLLTIKNGSEFKTNDTHIVNNEGKFNMSGGYICGGNKSSVTGGGVYNAGTMTMTGGVIAANIATYGGGVYNKGTFNMLGGYISGNSASVRYDNAGGGGIYNYFGTVNISESAYITNNQYSGKYDESLDKGMGWHGGGGLSSDGGTVTMSGGYVTGNQSSEAGGGIYIGYFNASHKTTFTMSGGIVARNVAINSEGGGIRIAGAKESGNGSDGYIGEKDNTNSNKIYITHNETQTSNDWGGGGIFVQENGNLYVYNSLITENEAGGFGGGVAACPTGTILVVKEHGTAIYGNTASGKKTSGGTGGKNDDSTTLEKDTLFKGSGFYQDYYCVNNHVTTNSIITMILGEMLGEGSANWKGRIDNEEISITKTGYKTASWLCGLTANPDSSAQASAVNAANVYITNNKSNIHGGGIMTNGNVNLGDKSKSDTVAPPLVVKGTKSVNSTLSNVDMTQFEFILLDKEPTKDSNGNWVYNSDNVIGSAHADNNGNFTIATENYYTEEGDFKYYLIEKNGSSPNIEYDSHMYTIKVKIKSSSEKVLGFTFTKYSVDGEPTVEGFDTTNKVYFDNSSSNWSKVYAYAWNSNTNECNATWHGVELTQKSGNIYTYEVTNNNWNKIIFNDGGSKQTDKSGFDLKLGYYYTKDGVLGNGNYTVTQNDDSYELTILNTFTNTVNKPIYLNVKKVDESNNIALSGAVFELYKLNNDNTLGIKIGTGTSDTSGLVQFNANENDEAHQDIQLTDNTQYCLIETTPPSKYTIAGPWIIQTTEADNDGIFTATLYTAVSNTTNDKTTYTIDTNVQGSTLQSTNDNTTINITATIPNSPVSYSIPSTGGNGSLPYTVGGISLLSGSVLLLAYIIIKRRKEDIVSS